MSNIGLLLLVRIAYLHDPHMLGILMLMYPTKNRKIPLQNRNNAITDRTRIEVKLYGRCFRNNGDQLKKGDQRKAK